MNQITLFGKPDVLIGELMATICYCKDKFSFIQIMEFNDRVQMISTSDKLVEFVRNRFVALGYSVEIR